MKLFSYAAIFAAVGLSACTGAKPAVETAAPRIAAHREAARGVDWLRKGCRHRAWESFLKAHRQFTLAGDPAGAAMALNNLGTVYRAAGDISGALVFFDEAVALYRHLGKDIGLLQAMSNRAAVLIDDSRWEDAASTLNAARQIIDRLQIPFPPLKVNRGIYFRKKGAFQTAQRILETAVRETDPHDFEQTATARSALGHLFLEMGRPESAFPHFSAALAADRAAGNFPGIAGDLQAMGKSCLEKGDTASGVHYLKQSLLAYAALKDKKKVETLLDVLEKTCRQEACRLEGVRHLVSQYLEGPLSHGLCD